MNVAIPAAAVHTTRRKLCPVCGKDLDSQFNSRTGYSWGHGLPLQTADSGACDYSEPESTHKRKKANDRSH